MQRVDSLEKTLMLEGTGGRSRRGRQKMRWLDGITTWWAWVWVNSGSWWWTGRPGVLRFMGSQRVRHNWVTELNWTELNGRYLVCFAYHYISSTSKWCLDSTGVEGMNSLKLLSNLCSGSSLIPHLCHDNNLLPSFPAAAFCQLQPSVLLCWKHTLSNITNVFTNFWSDFA